MTNSLEDARKEGYSDDEILDYYSSKDPAQKSKFDAARQEGYSSSDILQHLSQTPQQKQTVSPIQGVKKLATQATEKALRTPAQYALGAIEASPPVLGAEIIGRTAGALHGAENVKTANFLQNAQETIAELEDKKYYHGLTPEEDNRLQETMKLARMSPEEIKKSGFIKETPKIAPSTLIEAIPGQEPQGPVEKGARLVGMFREAGISGAEKLAENAAEKLSKFMSPQAIKEVEGMAAAAPLAATAVTMNELFGIPEWATVGIGGLTSLGWKGLKSAASWAGKKFALFDPANVNPYKLPASIREEIQAARKNAEEQVEKNIMSKEMFEAQKPFFDIAEEYGIIMPPSGFTDSRYFKSMENMIVKNDLSGPQVQAFRQEAAKRWAEAQQVATKDMQRNVIFSEPGAVAESMLDNVTRAKHATLKEEAKNLYSQASEELSATKNISTASVKEIEDSLNRVAQKSRSESLIPTSAQESAAEVAEKSARNLYRTKEDLQNAFGDASENMIIDKDGTIKFVRNINGKTLADTIRSLNDRMDWDNPAVVNLFQDTRKTIQDVMEKEYSKTNPSALKLQKDANKKFAEQQRLFGEDARWKKWGLKQDVLPDELLRTINNVERLKAFEKDFPEAKELLDHFKHLKVQEKLKPFFEARSYDPGKIANAIATLERDPMFRHMVSEKTMSNLNDLAKLDAHLERTSKKFFSVNPPSEEATSFYVEFKNLFNPNVWMVKLGEKVAKDRMSKIYSEILLDPKFTSRMKQLGEDAIKAAESGSPAKINSAKANIDLFWEEMDSIAQATAAEGI